MGVQVDLESNGAAEQKLDLVGLAVSLQYRFPPGFRFDCQMKVFPIQGQMIGACRADAHKEIIRAYSGHLPHRGRHVFLRNVLKHVVAKPDVELVVLEYRQLVKA